MVGPVSVYNVTGWGIMFICGMILRCASIYKTWLESRQYSRCNTHCHI